MVAELAHSAKAPTGPSEGEYQTLQELAAGGMGSVYLARATNGPRKGQLVALKRMHPHLERNPQFAASFFDEAWITAGLRHPHVVDIFDWGTDKDGRYIALEFVAGESLLNLLKATRSRGHQMPIEIVLYIIAHTAEALHSAHELRNERGELRHLVHRDVTPSNVLISRDGDIKLIDFGVAKARERLQDNTQTNTLKGKFGYMSPEQARGVKNIDRRSDLWSLGVVLWECLAGKRLFKSDSELEILRMVTEETPASVRSVRPEVPEAIDQLLRSVFAKNRDDRIGSCAEFADYLWAVFREEGFTTNEQVLSEYFQQMLPDRCQALDRLLSGSNENWKLEPMQSGSGSGSFQGTDPRSGAVALPIPKGPTGSFPAFESNLASRPTEVPAQAQDNNRKVVVLLFGVVVLLAGALGTVLYHSRTTTPTNTNLAETRVTNGTTVAPTVANGSTPTPTNTPNTQTTPNTPNTQGSNSAVGPANTAANRNSIANANGNGRHHPNGAQTTTARGSTLPPGAAAAAMLNNANPTANAGSTASAGSASAAGSANGANNGSSANSNGHTETPVVRDPPVLRNTTPTQPTNNGGSGTSSGSSGSSTPTNVMGQLRGW